MEHLFRHITTLMLALAAASVSAASVQNQEEQPFVTATGLIAAVRPQEKQIVLQVRKGEPLTLTADDRTRIEVPQSEGKLEKLKEGQRVRVTFYARGGVHRLLSVTEPRFTLGKLKQGINLALSFARSAALKDREEYKKNLKLILQDVDENIAALEAEARKTEDAAARKQLAQDAEAMRAQRLALADRLARVDAATADNWAEVRDGVNTILGEVQRLLERARAKAVEKGQP